MYPEIIFVFMQLLLTALGEKFDFYVYGATATTDHVYVTMYGSLNTSPQLIINKVNPMQANTRQYFYMDSPVNVGWIQKIKIEFKGNNTWKMTRIIIMQHGTMHHWIFDCAPFCTFDHPADHHLSEADSVIFQPINTAETFKAVITTKTGSSAYKTYQAVYITLKGTLGESTELSLNKNGKLLSSNDDRIITSQGEIGDLLQIKLTLMGSDSWNIQEITLINVFTKKSWTFPCANCELTTAQPTVSLTASPGSGTGSIAVAGKQFRFVGNNQMRGNVIESYEGQQRSLLTECAIRCGKNFQCTAFQTFITSAQPSKCDLLSTQVPEITFLLLGTPGYKYYEMIQLVN